MLFFRSRIKISMNYQKKILLFSSPRSGSTLLANIIRSHPDICYFNEIFTRSPVLLPNFEKAFHNAKPAKWLSTFEDDLRRLEKYKFMEVNNFIHRNKISKTIFFLIIKIIASLNSRLWNSRQRWDFFYKVYSINSLHEPPIIPFYRTQFKKSPECHTLFIKDIRIYKAYRAFKYMYPDAYFIYLIRNPYFQIASHLRLKSYEEIVKYVNTYYLKKTFSFPHLVDEFFAKTPEQTFALLWLLANEWVYQDIMNHRPEHLFIIKYEDLILNMTTQIKKLFTFLEMDYPPQTKRFLQYIVHPQYRQKHSRSIFVERDLTYKICRPRLTDEQLRDISLVLAHSTVIKDLGYNLIT